MDLLLLLDVTHGLVLHGRLRALVTATLVAEAVGADRANALLAGAAPRPARGIHDVRVPPGQVSLLVARPGRDKATAKGAVNALERPRPGWLRAAVAHHPTAVFLRHHSKLSAQLSPPDAKVPYQDGGHRDN